MAWVGYFTACFSAWLFRTSNGAMLKRMPLVGLAILAANVARNTILVAVEARGGPIALSLHEGVGLATIAIACVAIVTIFATCSDRVRVLQRIRVESRRSRGQGPTAIRPVRTAFVAMFVAAALVPLSTRSSPSSTPIRTVEWPTRLDGESLIPVALSAVERRFAGDFPGSIARFTAGSGVVVLRDVERPTRRLHPAADCYRALGYAIVAEHLERRERDLMWRCFEARRDGVGLRVCERLVDRDGQAFTDVSSWYWSALLGRSQGPWRATTIAVPMPSSIPAAT